MYTGIKLFFQSMLLISLLLVTLQFGGQLYELIVVTPTWIDHLSASVRTWNLQPQKFSAPVNMGIIVTVLINAAGIFIWRKEKKKWVTVAVLFTIAVSLSTLLFFVPLLRETILSKGANVDDATIINKSMQWYHWNWLRLAFEFISWYAFVRAFEKRN